MASAAAIAAAAAAAGDGKKKALDVALASILKAHGDGAVMRLG